jgi:hypothetical protein
MKGVSNALVKQSIMDLIHCPVLIVMPKIYHVICATLCMEEMFVIGEKKQDVVFFQREKQHDDS